MTGNSTIDKIALIVSIISFGLSCAAAVYSYRTTEMQFKLTNYPSVIDVESHAVGLLYANGFSRYPNGSIKSFDGYGHLDFNLRVMTPHVGNVSIEILNFTADNKQIHLDPAKVNETTVSYFWEDEKYHDLVNHEGLSVLDVSLELKGSNIYPDSSSLPAEGETIEFHIGWLTLRAILFDFQTNESTMYDFHELIRVRVSVPYS